MTAETGKARLPRMRIVHESERLFDTRVSDEYTGQGRHHGVIRFGTGYRACSAECPECTPDVSGRTDAEWSVALRHWGATAQICISDLASRRTALRRRPPGPEDITHCCDGIQIALRTAQTVLKFFLDCIEHLADREYDVEEYAVAHANLMERLNVYWDYYESMCRGRVVPLAEMPPVICTACTFPEAVSAAVARATREALEGVSPTPTGRYGR